MMIVVFLFFGWITTHARFVAHKLAKRIDYYEGGSKLYTTVYLHVLCVRALDFSLGNDPEAISLYNQLRRLIKTTITVGFPLIALMVLIGIFAKVSGEFYF